MTRKDYVAIARAIAAVREEENSLDNHDGSSSPRQSAVDAVDVVARRLASVLQQDNERFDRDRFLLACKGGK